MKSGAIPLERWSDEMTGSSQSAYHDLIAELSFAGFRSLVRDKISPTEEWRPSEEDVECALNVMSVIRGARLNREKVDSGMLEDASVLVHRLHAHLQFRLGELTFQPRLKGFGNLASCHPDLMTSEGVIELKTSAYPLRVEDFRQVLLYSFLCGENGVLDITFSLVNPRLGISVVMETDHFCELFSSESKSSVFNRLREQLSS